MTRMRTVAEILRSRVAPTSRSHVGAGDTRRIRRARARARARAEAATFAAAGLAVAAYGEPRPAAIIAGVAACTTAVHIIITTPRRHPK